MYIKIFDGHTAEEAENKVNQFLKSGNSEEFDLYNVLQSESMTVIDGKLERRVTVTLVFIERLYHEGEDDI